MAKLASLAGLVFSAILTMSLFTRLFGLSPMGLIVSIAALLLFEVGALIWDKLKDTAQGGQRTVTTFCLVFTVSLSLTSSAIEIAQWTHLSAEALKLLDLEFITLLTIVGALVVNTAGGFLYGSLDPSRAMIHSELNRQAKLNAAREQLTDDAVQLSIVNGAGQVRQIAADIAQNLGTVVRDDVIKTTLSLGQRPIGATLATILPPAAAGGSHDAPQFAATAPPAPGLAQNTPATGPSAATTPPAGPRPMVETPATDDGLPDNDSGWRDVPMPNMPPTTPTAPPVPAPKARRPARRAK